MAAQFYDGGIQEHLPPSEWSNEHKPSLYFFQPRRILSVTSTRLIPNICFVFAGVWECFLSLRGPLRRKNASLREVFCTRMYSTIKTFTATKTRAFGFSKNKPSDYSVLRAGRYFSTKKSAENAEITAASPQNTYVHMHTQKNTLPEPHRKYCLWILVMLKATSSICCTEGGGYYDSTDQTTGTDSHPCHK